MQPLSIRLEFLASQLRRAISSISLNLSEGFGVAGGNGRVRFETALGSLNGAKTAIRIAAGTARALDCLGRALALRLLESEDTDLRRTLL